MKNQILKITFLLSLLIITFFSSYSQGKAKITPYIQLQYFKNTDGQRILQTALTYSANRMELPLPGMNISFYKGAGNKELIVSAVTDNKGIARIELTNDLKLSVNSEGMWSFSSEYEGNDSIEAAKSEITIKDVRLGISFSEVDSIKTIAINAFMNENGKDKPVSGEVVKIYVPRMFSLLPVGEVTLDEKGSGTFEFPSDLPGDKDGNVTIISRFEENPTFGNVEKKLIQRWGIPTDYSVPTAHRALWTKTPPMWMIITLSILLTGVWGHYLFAVISLILIRIDAKRKAAKEAYKILDQKL
jgi:hypothetical protein